MIGILTCSVGFAIVNYLRGRGYLPVLSHLLAAFMWAVIAGGVGAYAGHTSSVNGLLTLLIFIGTLAWVVPGWGLFFSSFTGLWKKNEKEAWPCDVMSLALVPFVSEYDMKTNRLRGLIAMALRGFLYSFPLFSLLAWYITAWAIALWPLMLLQGPIYYANRSYSIRYGTAVPEVITGALMGTLVGAVIAIR
jgi:hypothetical protein